MSDEFLYEWRQMPRPEFAEALKERIFRKKLFTRSKRGGAATTNIKHILIVLVKGLLALLLVAIVSIPATARNLPLPSSPNRGCTPSFDDTGPSYPLGEITIQQSEELLGVRKTLAVRKVLQAPDVQNVLKGPSLKMNVANAVAVLHTLEGDNTLFVVVIPRTEKEALIYYELARPLLEKNPAGEGYKSIYKSQAMILAIEDQTVKLVSTSINGRLVSLVPRPLSSSSCGGCISIFGPWAWDSRQCTSWDNNCMIGCGLGCGGAAGACITCISTGNWGACVSCISGAFGCGWCVTGCCRSWIPICASCGPLP